MPDFIVTLEPPASIQVSIGSASVGVEVGSVPAQDVALSPGASAFDVDLLGAGPKGSKGNKGDKGDQGVPGLAGASFVFQQNTPAADWEVTHGLSRFPNVTVVDSSGDVVHGDITYVSAGLIRLHFASAFSGTAYLN